MVDVASGRPFGAIFCISSSLFHTQTCKFCMQVGLLSEAQNASLGLILFDILSLEGLTRDACNLAHLGGSRKVSS